MNKKRSVIIVLTAMVAIATLLSGCSTGSSSNAKDSGKSADKVTLRFSWWGGDTRHKATLAAIEAYKKIAPNVTIEAEYQGFDGYQQKVKTQLASSNAPDTMQLDSTWMNELTKSDFFLDLSAQPSIQTDTFDKNFLDQFSIFNGKMVALPMGVNSFALLINKTEAEKLGIATDVRWTWDSIYEAGKKLHEQDKSKYLLTAGSGMFKDDFTTMLKQRAGKQLINDDYTLAFTQEDVKASFEWFDKALKAGVYEPLGEADLFNAKPEQNPRWINQDVPMTPSMSSAVPVLRDALPAGTVVTTTLPPILEGAKNTAVKVRPANLVAINAKTKYSEEAAKFVNWFLNDPEAATILGDVRSIPASTAAQKAAMEAGKLDAVVTGAVEAGLKNAGIVDNALVSNSEIDAIFLDAVQKVAYGKSAPEQAAAELVDNLNKKLKELQARG